MNALKLLEKDHRVVEALFAKFERASPNGKLKLARKLSDALIAHTALEEQLVYPTAADRSPDLKAQVLEGVEEHRLVKVTLGDLQALLGNLFASDRLLRVSALVNVLHEQVTHHVKEEREELFPRLRQLMGNAELEALGAVLEQQRRKQPRPPIERSELAIAFGF